MKNKCFVIIIFILGALIMLYPIVSNIVAIFTQTHAIINYQTTLSKMSDDDIYKELQEAILYNKQLVNATHHALSEIHYANLLNIGNVMGYIEIPKIDVYLPIYHGTTSAVLEKGVGHMEETSLPIGGDSTHCVLTGHTGFPTAKLFSDLTELRIGEIFYIHSLNNRLEYRVDQIKIVDPEDVRDLVIVPGEDHVTLVTCTPYGLNTHRLLVRGTRITSGHGNRLYINQSHLNESLEISHEIDILI